VQYPWLGPSLTAAGATIGLKNILLAKLRVVTPCLARSDEKIVVAGCFGRSRPADPVGCDARSACSYQAEGCCERGSRAVGR